jgi:hypothetical protein
MRAPLLRRQVDQTRVPVLPRAPAQARPISCGPVHEINATVVRREAEIWQG